MSAALSSLGARLQTRFPPVPHFYFFFFRINRDSVALVRLSLSSGRDARGFTEPLSCFLDCFSWKAAGVTCPSSFPLSSPGAMGLVYPVTTTSCPHGHFFGGLLEVVGSVPRSLSWQLHLNPMLAARLDFGAKLMGGGVGKPCRRRRKYLFNS